MNMKDFASLNHLNHSVDEIPGLVNFLILYVHLLFMSLWQ